MSITNQIITDTERSALAVKLGLFAIAREIAGIRSGMPLGKIWAYDSYNRRNYDGRYSDEQEGGMTCPEGTPIVIVTLQQSYSGGGDYMYVLFPQSYLEPGVDWLALEQARVDAENADKEEQERIEELRRAGEIEEAERATFERLKKKFEGDNGTLAAEAKGSGQ